jgi:hypothetical protein
MDTPPKFWDPETIKWVRESPFVTYKGFDDNETELTMHYNNTKLLTVGDRAELFCICYWDKNEEDNPDPLLFFDPPYMDFLKNKGFQILEVDNEDLIGFIEEKWQEVEAKRFADEFAESWLHGV